MTECRSSLRRFPTLVWCRGGRCAACRPALVADDNLFVTAFGIEYESLFLTFGQRFQRLLDLV